MLKDCHNCEHHTWGDEWWNCKTECNKCKYTDRQGETVPSNWKPLPMTHADRIRAMSDDCLAAQLTQVFCEGFRTASGIDLSDEWRDKIKAEMFAILQKPEEGE